MASSLRRWGLIAAKIVVTGGLLWLALRRVDFAGLPARLAAADLGWVLLAAALLLLQSLLIVTWRWGRVVAAIDRPAPFPRLLRFTLVAQFLNQALPATVGGDGMRMWLLHRDGRRGTTAVNSVLLERLVGLFGLMLMALAGMPRLLDLTHDGLKGWSALVLVAGGLGGMAVAALVVSRTRWLQAPFLPRWIANLAAEAATLFRRPALLTVLVAASVAGQVAVCGAVWAMARAFGVPLGLLDANLILPTLFVLLVVPISIGGWGLRESAMVVVLGLLGIAAGDAVLVSVSFGLVVLLLGLPGGLVWLALGAPRSGDPAP